jgi:hypothetical protein
MVPTIRDLLHVPVSASSDPEDDRLRLLVRSSPSYAPLVRTSPCCSCSRTCTDGLGSPSSMVP